MHAGYPDRRVEKTKLPPANDCLLFLEVRFKLIAIKAPKIFMKNLKSTSKIS